MLVGFSRLLSIDRNRCLRLIYMSNNTILPQQYKTSRACWLVLRVEIETNQSTHKKTKLRRREILCT